MLARRSADTEQPWPLARIDVLWGVGLFLLAFLTRFGIIARAPGGMSQNFGDDSAAYYAGADAIVHGRLPYHSFVLLHPPFLDLVLTPFAALGAITTDHAGWIVATIALMLLGSTSAVLVVGIGRRLGQPRPAAYAAGVFYAIWYGAVAADSGIRLENVACFATLLGLFALAGADRRRNALIGGAALGVAAASKIWGVVPLLVLIAWGLATRQFRRAGEFAVGAAVSLLVTCGPFFAVAPGPMWRMVVSAQLGRRGTLRLRVRKMTGIFDVFPHLHGVGYDLVVTGIVVALVATLALAALLPRHLPLVLVAIACLIVLDRVPMFFSNYDGYAAPSLAVAFGGAVTSAIALSRRPDRTPALTTARRTLGRAGLAVLALALAGTALMCVSAVRTPPFSVASKPIPTAFLDRAVAGAHCPTPDAPAVLIVTDTLSSTLGDGCPNWIDVSGKLYLVPSARRSRVRSVEWQRLLRAYLFSGDVVITSRPKLGYGPALLGEIHSCPSIGRESGYAAYRLPSRLRGV